MGSNDDRNTIQTKSTKTPTEKLPRRHEKICTLQGKTSRSKHGHLHSKQIIKIIPNQH
jgi:hypothetical protein